MLVISLCFCTILRIFSCLGCGLLVLLYYSKILLYLSYIICLGDYLF